ncbi:MAG: TldD/PmbA family protein [Firmicutes bacterium]|nr:TldD/PmbA family protein [Bacillota bacterium]
MKDKLSEAVSALSVDYLDIRMENRWETRIVYRGKKQEEFSRTKSSGGVVRALDKGSWGIVSFTDLSRIEKSVFLAVREAKIKRGGESKLAPAPVINDRVDAGVKTDPRDIPLETKAELMQDFNAKLMDHPHNPSSWVYYKDMTTEKFYINSEGSYIESERIDCGATIGAIAKKDGNVQTSHESMGGTDGWDNVLKVEDMIEPLKERAISLLDAEPAKGGKFDCVLDNRLTGTFIHEAFGHMSEADHMDDNESLQKVMVLNTRWGCDELTVVDDGSGPVGLSGTSRYDDEGVPTRKNFLIKDGFLTGRLHSRETAGKMGEEASGNARAIDFQFEPIVRMNNTYIEPRDWKVDEMIKDIEKGYYVRGSRGGMTNLDMFTFSAGEAFKVENGEIGEKVRDLTLTGNVFETMKSIDAIGDDLVIFGKGGWGGCGKAGQSPLPVGLGGPHIRIRNVIVGGR